MQIKYVLLFSFILVAFVACDHQNHGSSLGPKKTFATPKLTPEVNEREASLTPEIFDWNALYKNQDNASAALAYAFHLQEGATLTFTTEILEDERDPQIIASTDEARSYYGSYFACAIHWDQPADRKDFGKIEKGEKFILSNPTVYKSGGEERSSAFFVRLRPADKNKISRAKELHCQNYYDIDDLQFDPARGDYLFKNFNRQDVDKLLEGIAILESADLTEN